jgi:hypothetical protein
VDYRNDPTALRLYEFLQGWTRANPAWSAGQFDHLHWVQRSSTSAEIASNLLKAAEFREVQLAGILDSPDGELVRAVVGWVLPGPQAALFHLLVDAILLAAEATQRDQRKLAGACTLVGAAVIAVLLWGSR